MKRYIEQLIEDMHARMQTVNPPSELWIESEADPTNELELEDMAYVEQYIYGLEKKITEITEFDSWLFPTPESLSKKQRSILAQEMEKLLKHFNFYLDFPENYPNHLRYPYILNFWTEEHVPLSFGENHIAFCTYNEDNCPFSGYCKICDEVNAQMRYDDEQQKKIDKKAKNTPGSGKPYSSFPDFPF